MSTNLSDSWLQRTQRQPSVASSGQVIKLSPDQVEDATRYLTGQLTPEQLNPITVASPEGRARVFEILRQAAQRGQIANVPPSPPEPLLEELFRSTVGLGPIDRFLADTAIEQINIIGPQTIVVQQRGTWHQITDQRFFFDDNDHLRRVAGNLVRRVGQELSRFAQPIMDVRFAQPVLRIHINQTGRNSGVSMFIRRGRNQPFTIDQLVEWGNFDQAVANLLVEAAQRLIGLIVLGPVGTGKTVLLETYVDNMPNVPIVAVDDAGDFCSRHPWVAVFDLPSSSYTATAGSGLSLGAMTRAALREGDVLVVAELRGAEEAGILISDAPSMRAVLTTAHGSSAEAGLSRLVSIAQRPPSPYAGTNSANALRQDIAAAFPLVIQVDRRGDRRLITGIYHNKGWDRAGDSWQLDPLVRAVFGPQGEVSWQPDGADLDRIKAEVALDKLQRGGVAIYEARSPGALHARALNLLAEGNAVEASHLLSQVLKQKPGDEQVHAQLIQAMQQAGIDQAAVEEARPVIDQVQRLAAGKQWLEARASLKQTLSRSPGVFAFVKEGYPAYAAAARRIEAGCKAVRQADKLLANLGETAGLPWKSLEEWLERIEGMPVELLPEATKQQLEEAHIELLGLAIEKAPATNRAFFSQKLRALVGNKRASTILASRQPAAGQKGRS
jgi:pilus assembly protein CpaF